MKKYTVLEAETGMPLVPSSLHRAMIRHEQIIGKSIKNCLFYRKGIFFKWTYELKEFTEIGEAILKKVIRDKKFSENISQNVRKYTYELLNFSKKICDMKLKDKTNKELAQIFKNYIKILEELYFWGLFIEIMEVYNNLFSKLLQEKLQQLIKRRGLTKAIGEYFAILTTSEKKSFAKRQEEEFFEVLSKINKDIELKKIFRNKKITEIIEYLKSRKELNEMIENHLKNYCWVNYNYEGPEMDKKMLVDFLKNAIIKNIDAEKKRSEIREAYKSIKVKQKRFMDELKPDSALRSLLSIAKEFLTLKMIRKESIFYANFATDRIRKEFCKRFDITMGQARCMTDMEFISSLETGKVNKEELIARENEAAQLLENGIEKIFTGEKARMLSKQIIEEKVEKEIKEISGTCASPGHVKGIAKVITSVEDMGKIDKGDILIAMATNPNLVPAMKKAAAIITDMGGLTCHAAIVSRELGIPCVVGTKIATKVLEDGDFVEVDANKGIVRILEK